MSDADPLDRLTLLERATCPDITQRFWNLVSLCIHGSDCPYCCWEWQGHFARRGYGEFYLFKQGRRSVQVRAHRFAWIVWHRRPIPEALWALHYCDNPPCCNPHHLFLGVNQDNVDDKQRKGRTSRGVKHGNAMRRGKWLHGEQCSRARLTAEKVRDIRYLAQSGTRTKAELARLFGVDWCTIRDVLTRRTWNHVP